MIVVEQSALEMPPFQKVEPRFFSLSVAAFVKQMSLSIFSHLLKFKFSTFKLNIVIFS